ncbi:MAG: methionyl-tRNA formyltransferase, partial [Thermomicrobiales bacterium]
TRVVYFGTPAFAEPTLRRLAADPAFEIVLVVSQPDRPAGRGQKLESPPVARAARELGLHLYQPASLRTAEARQPLVDARADLFVVAAFGLIFGKNTLAIPRLGCVNLHASLLPAYRGASPILTAIAEGESETGVTLMRMDAGLDTGDIISSIAAPVTTTDTTESLAAVLAAAGAELAASELPRFARGELRARPQPGGATITRMQTKDDGWIDWSRPATDLERHVRAMWPWPRAWTTLGERVIQVHRAAVAEGGAALPGSVISRKGALIVQCGDGALALETVQSAGKGAMAGAAFASSVSADAVFGLTGNPGPQPPLVSSAGPADGE